MSFTIPRCLHRRRSIYRGCLKRWLILLTSLACSSYAQDTHLQPDLSAFQHIDQSALLVLDHNHQAIYSQRAEQLYIPASIVKLLTALLVLDHWGEDYQFSTDIYFDPDHQCLKIVGSGDPFLISEELDRMAAQIKSSGIRVIRGMHLDSSFFARQADLEGRGSSANPYDAPYAALAANFNSVALTIEHGQVRSGEDHTPMTATHLQLAEGLAAGQHRISLRHADQAAVYFSQLLTAKLNQQGVSTRSEACVATHAAEPWLVFSNSHRLEKVVAAMLQYSNNFIAQQLFLTLGAHVHGTPANAHKSQQVLAHYIQRYFAWQEYHLVEAAGLSRKNKLSARQVMDILQRFRAYRSLLGQQSPGIVAKSGTLNGVRNFAGYIQRQPHWLPFVVIINQTVPYRFREQIAEHLHSQLNSP